MTSDLVAVVTGSSRGAGKSIALALGQTGATVYVTGRSTNGTESPAGGTVALPHSMLPKSAWPRRDKH